MTSQARRLFQLSLALALITISCSTPIPTETTTPEAIQPEPTHPEAGAPGNGPDSIRPPWAPTTASTRPYSGHGETLVLIQYVHDGDHRIIFIDPFGLGFREFRLPEGIEPPLNTSPALSPDGAYFAYHSGSTGTADLALVVYDVNAESITIDIPLLSSDFPENFQDLADMFIATDTLPEDLNWVEPENIASELRNAFEWGITDMAWSPMGRYLAFSGQMEGPSSDLYVLDMQTLEVTRLTSGTGMIERLGWSPDGYWIRHTSFYVEGVGIQVTNHVASRDGSQVISFPTHEGYEWGPWLTNNVYLANEAANGPGTYALKFMDTRSGTTRTIFYDAFETYALDPATNSVLLQCYPFFDYEREPGLYLVEVDEPTSITEVMAPGEYRVQYLGMDGFPFVVYPDAGGTVLVRSDGTVEPLSDQAWQAAAAPTADRLALYNPRDEDGLLIFDVDQDQFTELFPGSVSWVEWRPDSGAIFYISGHDLHVYNMDTGEYMLIYAWPGSPVFRTVVTWANLP